MSLTTPVSQEPIWKSRSKKRKNSALCILPFHLTLELDSAGPGERNPFDILFRTRLFRLVRLYFHFDWLTVLLWNHQHCTPEMNVFGDWIWKKAYFSSLFVCLFGNDKRRTILQNDVFRRRLIGLAVDEVHIVTVSGLY